MAGPGAMSGETTETDEARMADWVGRFELKDGYPAYWTSLSQE